MGTVEKRDRHKKSRYVSPEKKLEREIKDCMHCRFFWGHNNRCANGTCCKLSKKKESKLPAECVGCSYYQGNGYNPNNGGYNNPYMAPNQGSPYGQPQKPEKGCGFGIAALIIGILFGMLAAIIGDIE